MTTPQAGPGLARILSVTVFVPGEKPHRFTEAQILAAGMQDGTSVAAVRNGENGQITEYIGLPLKIVKGEPSGLVAPGRSGGLLVPPT
jgi:hypothetical protein